MWNKFHFSVPLINNYSYIIAFLNRQFLHVGAASPLSFHVFVFESCRIVPPWANVQRSVRSGRQTSTNPKVSRTAKLAGTTVSGPMARRGPLAARSVREQWVSWHFEPQLFTSGFTSCATLSGGQSSSSMGKPKNTRHICGCTINHPLWSDNPPLSHVYNRFYDINDDIL